MKLEKVLDTLNSFEKNSFLKIIDSIIASKPKNLSAVESIISENNRDLKNVDNNNIARVFNLVQTEFFEFIKEEFTKTTSHLDLLIDIISREGNAIMRHDWFARLYENELKELNNRLAKFKAELEDEKSELGKERVRDYEIYLACLKTAFENDVINNQERKITTDEQSILIKLAQKLELSHEEVKLINYLVIPLPNKHIDDIISDLKSIGVIFYSKKNNTILVPDEIVSTLRKVIGKEIADRHYRRVLKLLREPMINLVCKKHNIDRKLSIDEKIRHIIGEGIGFSSLLSNDIFKPDTNLTEKKKFISEFCDKQLGISPPIKGTLLEEKISNLILHFEKIESDEKVGISVDGYQRLLADMNTFVPETNSILKREYQFQEENVLSAEFLLNFNIKPRDVLEIIDVEILSTLCSERGIKHKGDVVSNILEAYKDTENLLLENYKEIAARDLNQLKTNGIEIKEAELGDKFEELTKNIFKQLGFNVDEEVRNSINTSKDKADIIINLGNNELILIECKTIKEKGYNKFSSVSRQLKSYAKNAENKGYKVVKSLLIGPEFSDEFIKDVGLEYELNLSLISAGTLLIILNGFKESKLKTFPHNLLMRDVVINEDRILKAISK